MNWTPTGSPLKNEDYHSLSVEMADEGLFPLPLRGASTLRRLFIAPSMLLLGCATVLPLAQWTGVWDPAAAPATSAMQNYVAPVQNPSVALRQAHAVSWPQGWGTTPHAARKPQGPLQYRQRNDGGWEDEWQPEPEEDLGPPLPKNTRPDLKTLTDPNIDNRVVTAIDKLGGKVTIPDIATAAAVDLQTAASNARDLAYLTDANVLVSERGELLYDFGTGVQAKLASSSARAAAAESWRKIEPYIQKGVRITFGLALFASLAIIFTSITVLQSSSSSDRDREDRRDGGGGGGMFFFGPRFSLFGPNWWYIPDPFYGYYGPRKPPNELSFVESVYSFVFGDGDPNFNLDERRYRQIAQVIRDNDGAVIAEQLAPYLDVPTTWFDRERTATVDEAFVQPVLTRFNGRSEVTNTGDIVYVFDELSSTTGTRSSTTLAPILEEKETVFSRATSGSQLGAGVLGVVNLLGCLKLGSLLGTVAGVATLGPFLDSVRLGYPFLAAYAIIYVATPIWRYFQVQNTNAAVNARNDIRAEAAMELQQGRSSITRKLQGAKSFRTKERRIGSKDVIYDSKRDTATAKVAEDEFADFDSRLNNR